MRRSWCDTPNHGSSRCERQRPEVDEPARRKPRQRRDRARGELECPPYEVTLPTLPRLRAECRSHGSLPPRQRRQSPRTSCWSQFENVNTHCPRRCRSPSAEDDVCDWQGDCGTWADCHNGRDARRRQRHDRPTFPVGRDHEDEDLPSHGTRRLSRCRRRVVDDESTRRYRSRHPVEGDIRRQHATPFVAAPLSGVLKTGRSRRSTPSGDTVRFARVVESRYTNEFGYTPVDRVEPVTMSVVDGVSQRKGGARRLPVEANFADDHVAMFCDYLKTSAILIVLIGLIGWLWLLLMRTPPPPSQFPYYYL